jgi:uncharacterized protein (UPF0332 family)
MQADEMKALSIRRMEQAEQCLESAKLLLEADDIKGAANRSYYGIFHAIRAVLALEGKDFAKHSGVISFFRQNYIKTGILDVSLSDIITDAFQVRTECDYNDYYIISKAEVEEQVQNAERFIKTISDYLAH